MRLFPADSLSSALSFLVWALLRITEYLQRAKTRHAIEIDF